MPARLLSPARTCPPGGASQLREKGARLAAALEAADGLRASLAAATAEAEAERASASEMLSLLGDYQVRRLGSSTRGARCPRRALAARPQSGHALC